jgi:hypothetical protein
MEETWVLKLYSEVDKYLIKRQKLGCSLLDKIIINIYIVNFLCVFLLCEKKLLQTETPDKDYKTG